MKRKRSRFELTALGQFDAMRTASGMGWAVTEWEEAKDGHGRTGWTLGYFRHEGHAFALLRVLRRVEAGKGKVRVGRRIYIPNGRLQGADLDVEADHGEWIDEAERLLALGSAEERVGKAGSVTSTGIDPE